MELHLPSSLSAVIEQQKEKAGAFGSVHELSARHCPGQASLPGRTLQTEGIFNRTFHLALITVQFLVPSFAVSRGGLTDIEGEQLLRSHQSSAIRIQLPRLLGHKVTLGGKSAFHLKQSPPRAPLPPHPQLCCTVGTQGDGSASCHYSLSPSILPPDSQTISGISRKKIYNFVFRKE